MSRIKIQLKNKPLFYTGICLVFVGMLMPYFMDVYRMGVYDSAMKALREDNAVYILCAGGQLLIVNTLRAYPHYLGAFLMADDITFNGGNAAKLLKCLAMGGLILVVYQAIEWIYHIQYDIGVPAICMIFTLILLVRIDFRMVSPVKKAIVIFFMLCTFQCLDIMPLLNGYAFGQGETSHMIKDVALFLEADTALNIAAIFLFLLMLITFLLYATLLADENHIKIANLEKEKKTKELMEVRLKALENRTYMEMEQLVHDLKTPLTSILTLVGVLKLQPAKEKEIEYLNRIETSVENLSGQISEILDEQKFTKITVSQLLKDLLAQISNAPYAALVEVDNNAAEDYVYVNRIRFFRMLVNLIENAYYVVDHEKGIIRCIVRRNQEDPTRLDFIIEDNGKGMSEATMASVFETGFSTKGSSGLGLSFVKKVVDSHHGSVAIESKIGKGSRFIITIPEGGLYEE